MSLRFFNHSNGCFEKMENDQEVLLIKWAGLPDSAASWVRSDTLSGHERLVEAFCKGEEVAEVDAILARRVVSHMTMYLVKWKDGGDSTWEPRSNLVGCGALVQDFDRQCAKEVLGARTVFRDDADPMLMILVSWVMPETTSSGSSNSSSPTSFQSWIPMRSLASGPSLLAEWMVQHPVEAESIRTFLSQRHQWSSDDSEPIRSGELDLPSASPSHPIVAFSEAEVESLKLAVAKYPGDWVQIAAYVNRPAIDCQTYYNRYSAHMMETGAGLDDAEHLLSLIPSMTRIQLVEANRGLGNSVSGNKQQLEDRLRDSLYERKPFDSAEMRTFGAFLQRFGADWDMVAREMTLSGFSRKPRECENAFIRLSATEPTLKAIVEGYASPNGHPSVGIRSGPRESSLHAGAFMSNANSAPGRPVRERVGKEPAAAAAAAATGTAASATSPANAKRSKKDVAGKKEDSPAASGAEKNSFKPPKDKPSTKEKGADVASPESSAAVKSPPAVQSPSAELALPDKVPTKIVDRKVTPNGIEYHVKWNVRDPGRYVSIDALAEKYDKGVVGLIEMFDEQKRVDFRIEAVLDERKEGGSTLYCVKWVGYPNAFNRWEVRENLGSFEYLVDEFHMRKFKNKGTEIRSLAGKSAGKTSGKTTGKTTGKTSGKGSEKNPSKQQQASKAEDTSSSRKRVERSDDEELLMSTSVEQSKKAKGADDDDDDDDDEDDEEKQSKKTKGMKSLMMKMAQQNEELGEKKRAREDESDAENAKKSKDKDNKDVEDQDEEDDNDDDDDEDNDDDEDEEEDEEEEGDDDDEDEDDDEDDDDGGKKKKSKKKSKKNAKKANSSHSKQPRKEKAEKPCPHCGKMFKNLGPHIAHKHRNASSPASTTTATTTTSTTTSTATKAASAATSSSSEKAKTPVDTTTTIASLQQDVRNILEFSKVRDALQGYLLEEELRALESVHTELCRKKKLSASSSDPEAYMARVKKFSRRIASNMFVAKAGLPLDRICQVWLYLLAIFRFVRLAVAMSSAGAITEKDLGKVFELESGFGGSDLGERMLVMWQSELTFLRKVLRVKEKN